MLVDRGESLQCEGLHSSDARHAVDLSVVIPAFNEEELIERAIRTTLRELLTLEVNFEIIVVDDGSTDETFKRAEGVAGTLNRHTPASVAVLRYPANGGKGYAVRYGVQHSTGRWVAFLDADLDLHPRLLSRLVLVQQETGADVVIGSKRHPESVVNYPTERKLYSTAYYWLCRLLFGLPVHDTQTGIKLLRGDFARNVLPHLQVDRFAFDLEMLAEAHRRGLRLAEAPIELNFARQFGRIGVRDIAGILTDTFIIWLRLHTKRSEPLKQSL
ncbi:MAG: glycosyltransferase [Chloroflexi bacterium]|nr:glycosyltransferase [Chloroflexota bacterium]